MAKIRQFRNSFAAGQIDAEFLSRSDTQEYQNACEDLTNFELLLSGGARRRAGNQVIAEAMDALRIEPWEFDDGTKFLIAFSVGKIEFYNPDDWATVREITAAELVDEATVWALDYEVVLNTLIVCHDTFEPIYITRAGTFFNRAASFPFAQGIGGRPEMPYRSFVDLDANLAETPVWLVPAANTGNTTVQARSVYPDTVVGETDRNLSFWTDDHVGTWFKISEAWSFKVLSRDPTDNSIVNVRIAGEVPPVKILRFDPASKIDLFDVGTVLTGATTAATVRVVGRRLPDYDPTKPWQVPELIVEELTGTLQAPEWWFTNELPPASDTEDITDGTTTVRTVALYSYLGTSSELTIGGTDQWLEQAWSPRRGWPGRVAYHAGRLWFAASTSLPNYLWASQSQNFFNFDVGSAFPNEAIAAPVVGRMLQRIRHLVSGPVLEILTDQQEFYVPGYEQRPITPETFSVQPSSGNGALACQPVRMSYATFYAERSGAAIHRQFYDDRIRGLRSDLVSGAASSLIKNPVQLARQRGRKAEGQEVLWGLNSDGTAFQMRWWPVTQDIAFAPMARPAGEFWRSMAYLDDVRYGLVELADGTRILEEASDVCLMDQWTLLTNVTPLSVWTVPTRYATGEMVAVMTDEEPGGTTTDRAIVWLGNFEVDASGQINIGLQDYMRIYVGRRAEARVKPTPIDFVPMTGDTRMVPKKVVSYAYPVLDTFYFAMDNKQVWYKQTAGVDLFPQPRDNVDIRQYQLGYRTRQAPEVVSDLPLPVTLLGIIAEVEF